MNCFYRLEHKDSGLGPFRSLKEDERNLLVNYWDAVPYLEEKYPAPDQDSILLKNESLIPKGKTYKFCCLKESDIYDYFGNELLIILFQRGYIIKEYQEGIDFNEYVFATNSVVIFLD